MEIDPRAKFVGEDIWILGAGFSHQIHSEFPLMSSLSKNVRSIISDRFENTSILDNIELALSELKSNSPWKTSYARYSDMALYEKIINEIQYHLERPLGTLPENRVDLVNRLVNTWHVNKSHVLTLNYDLIIEQSVSSIRRGQFRDCNDKDIRFLNPWHIYPVPIPHARTRGGNPWKLGGEERTFSYYKLHGSLNYYTLPDPYQNQVLYHKHHNEIEELVEGLQLFMVPPTNSKQTFFEHPTLQTIWDKAAKKLANCGKGRIYIVGYSMPMEDFTMLSMLRNNIKETIDQYRGGPPEILIVNPDKEAAYRIKNLLGIQNRIGQITDVNGFLEKYASPKFMRLHVWDNKYKKISMESDQIYYENLIDGKLSEKGQKLLREFREKSKKEGYNGFEWFISREEWYEWYEFKYLNLPIDRWL